MADEDYKRKLTAIFSADVKGYSLLMADNEIATIKTITSYREIMKSKIELHKGRVVDSPGDNLLADFQSVVDAVQCAVEIQQELKARNEKLPSERRMAFRIGVNLGDIVQDGEQIFGDGVNIASRVESLAEPGGVAISGTTFDSVRNKLDYGYQFTGEQTVKNIANPVRIYKVLTQSEFAGKVIGEKRFLGKISRKVAITAILVLAIMAGGSISYYIYLHQAGRIEPAAVENMAFPLPDRPSIAVLPFDNMSGDPQQEFFSDGITEQIITTLSKVPNIFVIARNSTFTYKGRPVKVKQVAEELGVQYVLEGSVRRSGNRLRITAQLIDAVRAIHVWSETYDRELKEIFALQDEITLNILTGVRIKLTHGEQVRLVVKETTNIKAFEKNMEATSYLRKFTPEANVLAMQLYEEAIAMDPKFASAYNNLAVAHMMDVWLGLSKSPRESLKQAFQLCKQALSLNELSFVAYYLMSHIYTLKRQHEKAIATGSKALEICPNSAHAHVWQAMNLNYAGKPKDAIILIKKALRLSPNPPNYYLLHLSAAYRQAGQYEQALEVNRKALERQPDNLFLNISLSAVCSLLGREKEAHEAADRVLEINPKFSLTRFKKILPYKNKEEIDSYIGALQRAGLK